MPEKTSMPRTGRCYRCGGPIDPQTQRDNAGLCLCCYAGGVIHAIAIEADKPRRKHHA